MIWDAVFGSYGSRDSGYTKRMRDRQCGLTSYRPEDDNEDDDKDDEKEDQK